MSNRFRSSAIREVAFVLAFLWACWWLYIGMSTGRMARLPWTQVFLSTALPGVVFLLTAVLARLKQTIGGTALMIEAWMVILAYPAPDSIHLPILTKAVVLITLACPPLIAGFLFITTSARRLQPKPAEIRT